MSEVLYSQVLLVDLSGTAHPSKTNRILAARAAQGNRLGYNSVVSRARLAILDVQEL